MPIKNKSGNIVGVLGADYDADAIYEKMESVKYTIVFISALVLCVAVLLSYFFARSIVVPLEKFVGHVDIVAQGNLTNKLLINAENEIGHLSNAFEHMTENFGVLISQVSDVANDLVDSSNQLSSASYDTAKASSQISSTMATVIDGSNSQLQAVYSAKTTVENIAESIGKITQNVDIASNVAEKAVFSADEGSKVIDSALEQMRNIEQSVEESAAGVSKLNSHSDEIGQIVSVISAIANQTNLLALNAAIEAARAGEHGKGFAVVADEVRNLAEQSQNSAEQIASLIGIIQEETNTMVNTMSIGTGEVKRGLDAVNAVGIKFDEITKLVDKVNVEVQGISVAINSIEEDSGEIVSSINAIEVVGQNVVEKTNDVSASVEEQTASVEELSSLSQDLNNLAEQIKKAISIFRI